MTLKGDNMTGVRKNNRSAVLQELQRTGGTSRKQLAETLNLTPAAITHITAELLNEGLLVQGAAVKGEKAGRREVLLRIREDAGIALGVFINLREATVSASDLSGNVLFSESVVLPPLAPAEETMKDLADKLEALMKTHRVDRKKLIGLGIAVRGIQSSDGRSVVNSFGALDTPDLKLADFYEKRFGVPAYLKNNVRALFAAERFLKREQTGAEFFLRCEYGIGASLAVNGQIWHGETEQCAEIGHIPIIRRGGKLCSCGKSGCLETVASPMAIREDALNACSEKETPVFYQIVQQKTPENVTVEDVFHAARNGDGPLQDIVDRAVSTLGLALKGVIYLVDPRRITLYGRMFEDPYYLTRLMSEMSEGVDRSHHVTVAKSAYNHQLENRSACLIAVMKFFEQGGIRS